MPDRSVAPPPDGLIKVLDFGLARIEATEATSEIAATLIGPGAILGTTADMSQEQARGQPTDRRTDVWAFGVVAGLPNGYFVLGTAYAISATASTRSIALPPRRVSRSTPLCASSRGARGPFLRRVRDTRRRRPDTRQVATP